MFKFLHSKAWSVSAFSELPEIRQEASESVRHFCVVAGGLALILSRVSETEIRSSYPATRELYKTLKTQLARIGKTNATSEMISDVMHEVAQVADLKTRASLKACLEARSAYEAHLRSRNGVPSKPDSAMTQSPGPSTRHPAQAGDRTVMQEEILGARAEALRATVARARSSGMGSLG